jgi:hypothetical protein
VKSSEIKVVTPERINKSLSIIFLVFKDGGISGDCPETIWKDA